MICCGTDIIEIDRVKKAIEDYENEEKNIFIGKIYTKNEMEYCESKGKMKYQHYAARFAAKEATFKAISGFLQDKYEMSWKNAEIINDNNGRPKVIFNNIPKGLEGKILDVDISLSHSKDNAIAMVVIQFDKH